MCHLIECLCESHLQSSTACPRGIPLIPLFSHHLGKNSLDFFFLKHELLSFCFPVSSLIFLLLADALKFNKSVACGNVWCFIVLEIVSLNLSSTFSRVNMELAWNLILQLCLNSLRIWLQPFLIELCFSARKFCRWYTLGYKHYCSLKIFLVIQQCLFFYKSVPFFFPVNIAMFLMF